MPGGLRQSIEDTNGNTSRDEERVELVKNTQIGAFINQSQKTFASEMHNVAQTTEKLKGLNPSSGVQFEDNLNEDISPLIKDRAGSQVFKEELI